MVAMNIFIFYFSSSTIQQDFFVSKHLSLFYSHKYDIYLKKWCKACLVFYCTGRSSKINQLYKIH